MGRHFRHDRTSLEDASIGWQAPAEDPRGNGGAGLGGCPGTDMPGRDGAGDDLVRRAEALADARRMRDAIVIVLALLGKLDGLGPDDAGRTAAHEIADLFQDVSEFAALGAQAARRAAGGGNG